MTAQEHDGKLSFTQRLETFKQVAALGDMPAAYKARYDELMAVAEFDMVAMTELMDAAGIAISHINGEYQFAKGFIADGGDHGGDVLLTLKERQALFEKSIEQGHVLPDVVTHYLALKGEGTDFHPDRLTEVTDFFNRVGVATHRVIPTLAEVAAGKDINMTSRPDAGERARAKLTARSAAKAFLRKVMIASAVFVVLFIAAMVGIGYYLWQTKTTKYVTDTRDCTVTLSDNMTITGKRSYSYPYHELLGIGWRETAEVSTRTHINVPSKGITVMGLVDDPAPVVEPEVDDKAKKPVNKVAKGGEWWGFTIGTAEGGIRNLDPADTYVFVTAPNEMTAVASTSFCK